jgi:DNA-binding response OmpR family regulator
VAGILIIDDSLTVRMDLLEAFESAGFTATLSETISAAREATARGSFSLIVLDVLLPDGNGIGTLELPFRRAAKWIASSAADRPALAKS